MRSTGHEIEFCSKLYGFVSPPALSMFIDRESDLPNVRAAVAAFVSTKRADRPEMATWTPEERSEYIHRVSAIFHERRHVHDLLATTLGNHLFFAGLHFAITALTALYYARYVEKQDRIILPMQPRRVGPPPPFEPTALYNASFRLVEASAVLQQHGLVADAFQVDAVALLAMSFAPDDRYSGILLRTGTLANVVGPQAVLDVPFALLGMMYEEPGSSEADYQQFLQKLDEIATRSPDEARRDLHKYAEERWARVRPAADLSQIVAAWTPAIEGELRPHTDELKHLVRAAIADFVSHAEAMRRRVVAEPGSYFDFRRYMGEDSIEPLLFGYSRGQPASLADARPGLRYVDRETWRTFTVALTPAKHLASAGAPARSHPLYGPWIAVQEEQHGVAFGN